MQNLLSCVNGGMSAKDILTMFIKWFGHPAFVGGVIAEENCLGSGCLIFRDPTGELWIVEAIGFGGDADLKVRRYINDEGDTAFTVMDCLREKTGLSEPDVTAEAVADALFVGLTMMVEIADGTYVAEHS